jgi:hypothetical protein
MTQKANNDSNATIPRRTHLFCLIEATSIAGVCRKDASTPRWRSNRSRASEEIPQTPEKLLRSAQKKKARWLDERLATGLDGGR